MKFSVFVNIGQNCIEDTRVVGRLILNTYEAG